jgi:hypothetical protein
VGNAAIARMLSGATGPVLQRSPSAWKTQTTQMVKLKGGWTLKSRWPAVVTLIKQYGMLSAADLGGRAATLSQLEQSIQKWRANQAKNRSQSALDREKADAVDELDKLIAQERRELAALPAAPQAQAIAPPLAPPQPQPQQQPQPNPSTLKPPPSAPWAISGEESFEEEDEGSDIKLPSSLDDELPFALELGKPRSSEKEEEKAEKREQRSTKTPTYEKEEKREEEESTEVSGAEELEEYEPLPLDESKDPQFPYMVHLRVHMTRTDYLESIRQTGLIAGKEQGIGLPEETKKASKGRPDPAWLYALDLSNAQTTGFVSMEAGGEPIAMVSTEIGDKDVNYPRGGAVRYPPRAPPIRQFPQEATTYSFALPMTPRTKTGLTKFVNKHGGTSMTEDEVAKLVEVSLRRKIPLHVLKKFPKQKPTQ